MFLIALCLMLGVAIALDAATALRQSYNPYALYNFMDWDADSTTTSVGDLSSQTIKFGNLTVGSRASWLKGRPGVRLARETGSTPTAGLTSANTFQTSWAPTFNNTPFVVEMWFQFNTVGTGTFWSIANTNTQASRGPATCDVDEPAIQMYRDIDLNFRVSTQDDTMANPCIYTVFSPNFGQKNTSRVVAMYLRYYATPEKMEATSYQGTTAYSQSTSNTQTNLMWQDTQARLLFSSNNNAFNLDYNLLSFAIYPNISTAQITSLFQIGLPNAKPDAPNFGRSVPENVGGSIQFCPNVIGSSRDSDCLDYSNNATHLGLNQTHTLVPTSSLKVWILSLPALGVLTHMGAPITAVPTMLTANNSVFYTPPRDFTNWYATYGSNVYVFVKNASLLSFTYRVVDSDGATSNNATVTLEVYPTHNAPVSNNVPATSVSAGVPLTPTGFNNIIKLNVTNKEFIAPNSSVPTCSGATYALCSAKKDTPDPMLTVVTIKSLPCPSCGTLKIKDWNAGTFTDAFVGATVPANKTWCGQVDCDTYWTVFWYAPVGAFNSTSEVLGVANFTYTATDNFNLASFLGSTSLNVEGAGGTASVNWQQQVESNVANAVIEIRNGYYAKSDVSIVKQRNQTTISPQTIKLVAADLTVTNPNITLIVTSLPARGGLFDLGSTTRITTVPHPVPYASNFSLAYQPSLPTESFGFEFNATYASFQFYAISNSVQSNTATQTINVVDTNDEVSISWYGPINSDGELFFSSPSDPIPQSWGDVPDNNLYINFTDPDGVVTGEPWYNIKLDSINSDFSIFTNPDYYDELVALKSASVGGAQLGFLVFPGVKAKMASSWELTVNRSFAQKFLNPIRLRPNRPTGSTLTVTITDCQKIPTPSPYATSSTFDSADWTPIPVTKSIVIRGDISKPPEYQGVANTTILAVVYGVAAFIGVVLLICGVMIVRWCLRRSRGGGGGGGGSTKSSSGSASKKGGKKAKSAYLHTVEL